jgi:KDO2-lipid IV(A) lauroyltransferase
MNRPLSHTPAADLRQGETWTRAQRFKNDAILIAVRVVLALLVPLPPRLLHHLGRALGLAMFALLGGARRTARSNVARVFPAMSARESRALARRSYIALGGHLGDALAALDSRNPLVPLSVDEDALDLLAAARARRGASGSRGVLFASAHLGPWERVAATLVARGVPMTVVARETYDPRLSSIYERLRARRGIPAIYRGLPGASSRILRTLRTGGVLGIPMDLRSRVPSVEATFLGQRALLPIGPARIALRVGAAVVVGTVAPDASVRGGLRIRCTEIRTDDLSAGDAGERELTARIASELSNRIKELPGEWVWMHDRFPGNPVD